MIPSLSLAPSSHPQSFLALSIDSSIPLSKDLKSALKPPSRQHTAYTWSATPYHIESMLLQPPDRACWICQDRLFTVNRLLEASLHIIHDHSGEYLAYAEHLGKQYSLEEIPLWIWGKKTWVLLHRTLLPLSYTLSQDALWEAIQGIPLFQSKYLQRELRIPSYQPAACPPNRESKNLHLTPILKVSPPHFIWAQLFIKESSLGEAVHELDLPHHLYTAADPFRQILQQLGFTAHYEARPGQKSTWSTPSESLYNHWNTLLAHGFRIEIEGKPVERVDSIEIHVVAKSDGYAKVEGDFQTTNGAQALEKMTLHQGAISLWEDSNTYYLPNPSSEGYTLLHHCQSKHSVISGKKEIHIPLSLLDDSLYPASSTLALDDISFLPGTHLYQKEGVHYLLNRLQLFGGALLADEMGLGKTRQALHVLNHLQGPHLVVMPVSLLPQWNQQITSLYPSKRVRSFWGTERSLENLTDNDIVCTSYSLLRQDLSLTSIYWGTVVFDEMHYLNHETTQLFRSAYPLKARYRLGLTGTPVLNRKEEAEALLQLLLPKAVWESNPCPNSLWNKVALRRTKEQVGCNLPPLIDDVVLVGMSEQQAALYHHYRQQYRNKLLFKIDREGVSRCQIDALEFLLRLRQLACHPSLCDPIWSEKQGFSKGDHLLVAASHAQSQGSKILIFSQFASLLHLSQRFLSQFGISSELIEGCTRNREEVLERFAHNPSCTALFMSLKATGVGLDLPFVSHGVLLDPWWNRGIEMQAAARMHRLGQKQTVIFQRLIASQTIEEKIIELQRSKWNSSENLWKQDLSEEHLTAEIIDFLLS